MPNRIIKESICTSEKLACLSDFEFRLWVGLITIADDAGRGDARPAIVKGRVFPLRERVTSKDVETALANLAANGCISLYTVDGKSYYWFPSWQVHQRIRDCKPKYPEPPENDTFSQLAADCGELRLESNPIQSESNTNPNTNPNPNTCASAFDSFWNAYPKKVGKEATKKAFAKVKMPVEVLLDAIEKQKQSEQWTKDNGQYIPNPTTWLNQGRWEDELKASKSASSANCTSTIGRDDAALMRKLLDKNKFTDGD